MKNEKGTDLTSGGILTRGRMRLDLLSFILCSCA